MTPDDDDDEVEVRIDECVVVKVTFQEQITLTLTKCKTGAKSLPGMQVYQILKIVDLKVIKEGNGAVDTSVASKAIPTPTRNNRSFRPIGSHSKYRNDNQHLEYLLPVQVRDTVTPFSIDASVHLIPKKLDCAKTASVRTFSNL